MRVKYIKIKRYRCQYCNFIVENKNRFHRIAATNSQSQAVELN